MRAVLCAVGVLAVGGLAHAQPPAPAVKDGYWKPETVVFDGKPQLAPADRDSLLRQTAGGEHKMYLMSDPKAGKGSRVFTASFRTSPTNAGTFEMEVTDGPRKGMKVHGIYEVAGDRLSMCYGPVTKPRPTKFEAPAGTDAFFESWTYLNPQPKAAGPKAGG